MKAKRCDAQVSANKTYEHIYIHKYKRMANTKKCKIV